MKRTVVITAGLLAFGLAGYLGSQLRAQQGAAPAPARPTTEPRTRIAILNVNYVYRNYDKFKNFMEEQKAEYKVFEDRAKPIQKQMEALAATAQDPKQPPDQREIAEKEFRKKKREVEDIQTEAKMSLGKKTDEVTVIIYREIQDIAHRYALAHNFDMVLHYTEATTQADYYSPANVARKLNAVALMPLYYDPSLDISRDVVISLNSAYSSTRPTPAAARPVGN